MSQLNKEECTKAKELIRFYLKDKGNYPEIVLQTLPKIYKLLDENGLCRWDYGTFQQQVEQIFIQFKSRDQMSRMQEELFEQMQRGFNQR